MKRIMELQKRKKNRLETWNYSNSGSCFLTICTKGREKCLSRIRSDPNGFYTYDSDDHRLSIELTEYGKIAERYLQSANNAGDILVEHYVIMPDHIHVIVTVLGDRLEEKDMEKAAHERIAKFLSSFKTLCHKTAGMKFLQRLGYDHIIRNHQDYEETIHYMNRNPARWYHREIYGTEQ